MQEAFLFKLISKSLNYTISSIASVAEHLFNSHSLIGNENSNRESDFFLVENKISIIWGLDY